MAPSIKPYPTRSAESTKLSRRTQQLQHNLTLRLSYARFKVENGWSALTLDEVENLWSRPFRVQQQQRDAESKAARDLLAEQEGEEEGEAEEGVRRTDQDEVDEEALFAGMELEWIAQSQEQEGAAAADNTRAPPPQPSANALGKRKAIEELLPPIPTSSRSPSTAPAKLDSVYSHLDKLPNLAPAARLHSHSTTPSTRFNTSSQSNQSGGAGGGAATLPSSYEDFWTKLGSPSTVSHSLSAGGAGSTTTATSSNHSGPPSSPSTTRSPTNPTHRSPINRKRSPFRPAVILPAKQPTSTNTSSSSSTSTGTRLSRNLGGSGGGGMPLGSQASFSSLPPLPPLPFPSQSQQDQQQRDRSHSSSGVDDDDDDDPPIPIPTIQRGRQQTRGTAMTNTVATAATISMGEDEGTSQDPQEELTMEAIEAAF